MLYKYCRDYSTANGTHYWRRLRETEPSIENSITTAQLDELTNEEKKQYCYFQYVPNDPEEFVLIATDHVSLLSPEQGAETQHATMSKWITEYCRKMLAKRFNYCVLAIQQLQVSSDKQEFTKSGDTIVEKLLPSLDKLANNLELARDYYVVLGLFAPERYQIPKYLNYDVTILRDNFRVITIMKNRLGTPNLKLPVYFNGASNTFFELPKPNTEEMKRIYEHLKNK